MFDHVVGCAGEATLPPCGRTGFGVNLLITDITLRSKVVSHVIFPRIAYVLRLSLKFCTPL